MKCLVSGLLALALPVLAQGGGNGQLRQDINYAKSRIYPCLVNISVVSKSFSGGRTVRRMGAGSGTIISPGGHVLTNYHVARDALRITCTLTSGEQIPADIVGDDAATDLSILKMRLAQREDPTKPLPFAILGDSEQVKVGDHVMAVGNPLSLSSSMTLGIVSNPRRVFLNRRGQLQDLDFGGGNKTGVFTVWIQHDALILPGNSGGPLVNLRGEIIGVNTRGGSGYGFASPAKLVKAVVNQILTFGKVRRGWIGASFLPVGRLGKKKGVLVANVLPTSPAEKAGLKPGDTILKIGDIAPACRFFEEIPLLYGAIAELRAGRKFVVLYLREGKELTTEITVAAMADYVGEVIELRQYGITVQQITSPMALARRYPDAKGVLVTGIRAGQPFEAAKPKLVAGDVVLSVDGQTVTGLAGFKKVLADTKKEEVSVVYRRNREILVTLVKLKPEKIRKPGGELAKAWLGVKTQVLTPKVAQALGIKGKQGFRITEVYPHTKAFEAGLKVGDILLALDGEPLKASRPQDARDLRNRIEDMSIGEDVEFTLLRGGREVPVEVELEESPASALDAKTATNKEFEFKVRELTFMDRIRRKLPPALKGVLVTEVKNGGWAAIGGLATGDVLCSIGSQSVASTKVFKKVMKQVIDKQPKLVSLFVRRGFGTTYVFIEPDWKVEKGTKK